MESKQINIIILSVLGVFILMISTCLCGGGNNPRQLVNPRVAVIQKPMEDNEQLAQLSSIKIEINNIINDLTGINSVSADDLEREANYLLEDIGRVEQAIDNNKSARDRNFEQQLKREVTKFQQNLNRLDERLKSVKNQYIVMVEQSRDSSRNELDKSNLIIQRKDELIAQLTRTVANTERQLALTKDIERTLRSKNVTMDVYVQQQMDKLKSKDEEIIILQNEIQQINATIAAAASQDGISSVDGTMTNGNQLTTALMDSFQQKLDKANEEIEKIKEEKATITTSLQTQVDGLTDALNQERDVAINFEVYFQYKESNDRKGTPIYLSEIPISKKYHNYFFRLKPDIVISFKTRDDRTIDQEKVELLIYETNDNGNLLLERDDIIISRAKVETINLTNKEFKVEENTIYFLSLKTKSGKDLLPKGRLISFQKKS